jgi:hypothetical protein
MTIIINTANKFSDFPKMYQDTRYLSETGKSASEECEIIDSKIYDNYGSSATCVFYTLRETLINRIGVHIFKDNINPDNVQIYVYKDGEFTRARFDNEGCLKEGWKFGFYEPNEVRHVIKD